MNSIPSLLVPALVLAAAISPGVAETVILSESFQFGEGVPGRAEVKAGDPFLPGPVQAGEGEWQTGGKKPSLAFVEGGGIRFVQDEARGLASFRVALPPEAGAKNLEAVMEFVPGTLWGKADRSGIVGLWLGLLEDPESKHLLADREAPGLVVARFWPIGDNTRAILGLRSAQSSVRPGVTSSQFMLDPGAVHRLTLRVNPASRTVEATLEDAEGVELAKMSDEAPNIPEFHCLRIDMTSLRNDEAAEPPVIKSIVLRAK